MEVWSDESLVVSEHFIVGYRDKRASLKLHIWFLYSSGCVVHHYGNLSLLGDASLLYILLTNQKWGKCLLRALGIARDTGDLIQVQIH